MILSIDLGTSSIKATLVDKEGKLYNFQRQLHDSYKGWAKLDFLKDIISNYPVKAIAISSQGPSIIPLLKDGTISEALLYNDNKNIIRNGSLYNEAENSVKRAFSSVFLPKVLYLKEHHSELYDQTQFFLTAGDYLVYLLTGTIQTSLPTHNDLYHTAIWDNYQIKGYGLDPEKFPPFTPFEQPLGLTNGSFSLQKNIPVILSTFDFLAALVGTGAITEDIASNRSGSSEGLNFFVQNAQDPIPFDGAPWRTLPHPVARGFNRGLVNNGSQSLFAHLMSYCGYNDLTPFLKDVVMVTGAPSLSPNLDELWPWLSSHSLDDLLKKVETHPPLAQAHAIIVYYLTSFKKIIFNNYFSAREIRLSGGMSYSDELNQLKANICGIDFVRLENPHAELTGVAAMAYTKMLEFPTIDQAVKSLVRISKRYTP